MPCKGDCKYWIPITHTVLSIMVCRTCMLRTREAEGLYAFSEALILSARSCIWASWALVEESSRTSRSVAS
jgi:hypothetical protein